MTRSRSKFGRFVDHMRRNVLSYKYLRHNILMTALVVVMALCVFAVISFGEKADPLADELYANDSVTINKSQAVMMAACHRRSGACRKFSIGQRYGQSCQQCIR